MHFTKKNNYFPSLQIALILLFVSLPLTSHATSHIKISSWQENVKLTRYGKTSEALIKGKIHGLPKRRVMSAFSISFDVKREISISQIVIGKKVAQYSFTNNVLTITFPKAKANNEPLSIYFSYKERYDKINEYLRQEAISIPPFAAGAHAKISISFPGYLESATLNPNISKYKNQFIYNNTVPREGVREIIKLTPAQSTWNVAIKVKIKSNKSLSDVKVTLPTYYQNGGQKVEDFISKSTITPSDWSKNDNSRTFHFKTDDNNLTIHNLATISSGGNNRTIINRDPNQYLTTSWDEKNLLTSILWQIKNNPDYQDLPLYAKIGKFTHDYIHYDIRYLGKLPKVHEIMKNPNGVCTEYATLYNALARIAGIPSVIVNGAACGEYDKCQGHAWNMIYINDQWISVDPTWDLMSGIVSSSHVYFSDDGKGEIAIKYRGSEEMQVNSKMDFEMKKF